MWRYEQSTGRLDHNGLRHTTGYSGHAEGKNNPALQDHPSLGPIPRGAYTLIVIKGVGSSQPCDYEGKKAPVFHVVPKPGTNTFGRSGFLIHGDSVSAPGTASLGCVIENHGEREAIFESRDTDFEVV